MIEAKTVALVLMLLSPVRHYFQAGHPVEITLDRAAVVAALEGDEKSAGELTLMLLSPEGEKLASAAVPAEGETIDLAALFPKLDPPNQRAGLWSGATHYVQLYAGEKPVGSPLVVVPAFIPGLPPPLRDKYPPDSLRIDVEKRAILHTDQGDITIAFSPEAAPNTCLNFQRLVAEGFYSHMKIHRIVPQFVVQFGDPTGSGAGTPGYYIDLEPSAKAHNKGTLSMARQGHDVNTNGSQVFICLTREKCAALDGKYTAFGDVVEGWDVVEKLAGAEVDPQTGRPKNPPVIQSASLVPAPPRVGK